MNAIFVFTKDRPQTLAHTLNCLLFTQDDLYLIDDSTLQYNRLANRALLKEAKNATYFDNAEQTNFLKNHFKKGNKLSFLFNELGTANWNLGYCRNLALIISKIKNYAKVIFIDDDIVFSTDNIIFNLFKSLDHFHFSGSKITGLEDNSLIGYIAGEFQQFDKTFLSGGFLAFDPTKISNFFLNIYNEDWIWMFLNSPAESIISLGEVTQQPKDQFMEHEAKLLFQETGEIIVTGILGNDWSSKSETAIWDCLKSNIFWEETIKSRQSYLAVLRLKIINHIHIYMIDYLLKFYSTNSPQKITQIFSDYREQQILFKEWDSCCNNYSKP